MRSKAEAEQLVPADVAYVMTRDQWPDWHRDLGAKRVAQISAKQRPAAIIAAEDPRCDRVDGLAMDRSDPANIGFDVDCQNGERIHVQEADLR